MSEFKRRLPVGAAAFFSLSISRGVKKTWKMICKKSIMIKTWILLIRVDSIYENKELLHVEKAMQILKKN